MQKEKKIPIVYIADDNYVMPATVSILSLLKNFKNHSKMAEIYVVGVSLSKENEESLKKLDNVQILNLDNKYENLHAEHNHVTKAALFKFDIADIFKNYDKVLYLDCDTLILRDLTKLLKTDINGYYAAVVRDILAVLKGDANDIGVGNNYFNSGMMLLNIKKMREDSLGERLLDAKLNETVKRYMDQNVFNTVFKNYVKFLHPNYNFLTSNLKFTFFTLCSLFNVWTLRPVVVHFTYYLKPWAYKDVEFSKQWMKYYNLSEYKDVPLNLKEYPHKYSKVYYKRKEYDRCIIDILGLRFSYKKGGKDFRLFYP